MRWLVHCLEVKSLLPAEGDLAPLYQDLPMGKCLWLRFDLVTDEPVLRERYRRFIADVGGKAITGMEKEKERATHVLVIGRPDAGPCEDDTRVFWSPADLLAFVSE